MGKLDGYNVDLKGMTSDTVSYRWQADNDFFSAVQGSEIKAGSLDVALRVKQASGAYELEFQLKGEVEVTCDRCLEPMSQPIEAQCTLKVVLGEDYADDGEVVTVPEREGSTWLGTSTSSQLCRFLCATFIPTASAKYCSRPLQRKRRQTRDGMH